MYIRNRVLKCVMLRRCVSFHMLNFKNSRTLVGRCQCLQRDLFECEQQKKPGCTAFCEVFRDIELHRVMAHSVRVSRTSASVKSQQRRPNVPLKHECAACFKSTRASSHHLHPDCVLGCSQHMVAARHRNVEWPSRARNNNPKHVVTGHGQTKVTNLTHITCHHRNNVGQHFECNVM